MIKYIIPAESDQPQNDIPFNPSFSFFARVNKPNPLAQYDLKQIVVGIRQNPGWKSTIEQLRKLKGQNKAAYKQEKEKVPAFTPSGTFSYRNNRSLLTHASVMSLDFDDLKTIEEAIAFRDKLARLPETILPFISPSGLGVKVLIRLHTPTTETSHHSAWRAVKDFTETVRGFDVPPDEYAKDISRLCIISHDPDAYYNPNPAAFDWEAYLNDNPHLRQDGVHHSDELAPSDFQYDGEDIPQWLLDALSYLDTDDYHVWLAVGSALKHGDFPFELWDEWSQTSDKYKESDARYKWKKGFDRIPFDYIIKSAQREGWTPPWGKRIPKQILTPAPIPEPTEGWQEQQEQIEQTLASEQSSILLEFDTGVGKDYAMVSHILRSDREAERFVEMITQVELGDEKIGDFQQRQQECGDSRTSHQWRSVFHNFDSSQPFHIRKTLIGKSIQCIQPVKFDALRARGAIPQAALCPSCPVYDECRDTGYLSQSQTAQQADFLLTAQDGIFFDKSLAGFAKQVLHDNQRVVNGIVDEVKVHELFSRNVLTKAELQQIAEAWKNTPAGEFALATIDALEHGTEPDLEKVRQEVLNLSESQERFIIRAFTEIRIHGQAFFDEESRIYDEAGDLMLASGTFYPKDGVKIAIATSQDALEILNQQEIPAVFRHEIDANVLTLSYKQAIKFGFYEIPIDDDTNPILNFPKLHPNSHWTPLHQLQALFDQYPRIADTPIHYDGETLVFYLSPVVHPSLDRIIMMSATAETELIADKVFTDREVQVVEAEPARWEESNEVFQLCTAKAPRATVLDSNDNLKGFGQRAWDAMVEEIERTPDKTHAVITYKCLQERYNLPSNVVTGHYGAVEGFNERFADCSVFWFLFDPRLPPHEAALRAKMIFGRDDEPLNHEYDKRRGVYVDDRLQRIADHYAIEQLLQAIGRARLVRRTGVKVVIFCARELPGISGRAETTLFNLQDFIIAGGLDKLKDQVKKREAREAQLRETIRQYVEEGMSDNKICKTLRIHHVQLREIKAEVLPSLDSEGMSQSSQLAISNIIESCEPVTNEIKRLIHSGLTCTKDLCDRLNESHSQSPDATRQQLTRLVKVDELIRMRRGVYALPNASCDFLPDAAPTAPQTSIFPPLEFGIIPALNHLSAPVGSDFGQVSRLAADDVRREHDYQGDVACLEPFDIHRLMRAHPDQLAVNPFVQTAKALDAVVEYRGWRLSRLTFDILSDPENYEELLGPFMGRFYENRGRADPDAVKILFPLVLRTWEGKSWVESLLPKFDLRHSLVALFRDEHSADSSLGNIHSDWVFACLNEALIKHFLVPFVEHSAGIVPAAELG